MAEQQATRLICAQCHDLNETVDANGYCEDCEIHLCEKCFSTHTLSRQLRYHKLLGKTEMPKVQTQLEVSNDMCTILCKDHKDYLKFYCKADDIVICSECLNQAHKKCPETLSISDLPSKDTEFQAMKDKLNNIKKELNDQLQKSEEQQIESAKQSSTAKADVEKFRKQFGALNEKLAQEECSVIDALGDEDGGKMEQIKANCENETKRITELEQKLKALHEAKKNCDLFVTIKMSATDVKAIENQYWKDKGRNTIRKYHFVAESRLSEVVHDVKSYGGLVDESGKDVRKGEVQNRVGPLVTSQRVVQVKHGKIEDEEADVIINSANIDLVLKQNERTISTAIEAKAGKEAETALKAVAAGKQPKYGDVFDADPGKMRSWCKKLYHVLVKDYSPSQPAESEKLMTKIITECLRKACASGHKTISFPAIGTGVRKHPTDVVAKLFLQSILNVVDKSASIEVINIVILEGDKTEQGEDKLDVFEREFTRQGQKSGVKKVFALPN